MVSLWCWLISWMKGKEVTFCHKTNVKQKNPYPPKRQIDVRRGKMSMDVTPRH